MKKDTIERDYSDIIDLPHPDPVHHQRMTLEKRAAHMQPFASLPKYFEDVEQMRRDDSE